MIINISEVSQPINYFIVSIYKVFILYLFYILYLCIVLNKSFNPEIGGPLPPYPLYLLYGRFLKSYTKITKNFRLFLQKIMAATLTC